MTGNDAPEAAIPAPSPQLVARSPAQIVPTAPLSPQTAAIAPPATQPPRSSRRVPLPPSIVSPFDALALVAAPPAENTESSAESARRPLKDLFPPDPAKVKRASRGLAPAAPPPPPPPPVPSAVGPEAVSAETFYGFQEKPFSLSTDPRFFFHSTPHDAVSQQLLTSVRKREGLVVLTGEIGSGKTTLCRTVIEQLDRRTLTSLVTDPFVSGEDLLKTILVDFGVASYDELTRGDTSRHELSSTLLSFVESLAPLQASAIVIIDEAQNLPADVLEQVRILAEAGEASSLLQMILVGQPALTTLLRRREYASLQQRVTVRTTLSPLPADELDGYIMHRIAVAGTGPRVQFDQAALDRIYRLSKGSPRVVNLLADRALTRGAEMSSSVIDAALIDAAAEDLDLGEAKSFAQQMAASAAAVAALAVLALLGAGLAALVFHDTFARALAQWRH